MKFSIKKKANKCVLNSACVRSFSLLADQSTDTIPFVKISLPVHVLFLVLVFWEFFFFYRSHTFM